MTTTRREFLQGMSAFALLPTLRSEAALVLHGGHVLTMDSIQPVAEAVAIADGRFLAVGSNRDVLNLAVARTTRVTLGGRTVVPGFIDAHTHPSYAGYRHLKQVDCDLRSIAGIQDTLKARTAKTAAGEWVIGFKYDDTKTSDGRRLTRDDLDAVSRDHPALGAIPTPFSTYVYYHGEKMREYGAERLDSMFALRSFLDAGIRATQASDYPPGPFEPMMALQSEVTRTDMKGNVWGPRQRISVEEALRVGTLNGAYASFEERLKGSIEPGKLADLVVLGRDALREPPGSLTTIPVEKTMVGGRWVYES